MLIPDWLFSTGIFVQIFSISNKGFKIRTIGFLDFIQGHIILHHLLMTKNSLVLQSLMTVPVVPAWTEETVPMALITTLVPVHRHFPEISVKVIKATCTIIQISDWHVCIDPTLWNTGTSHQVHATASNLSVIASGYEHCQGLQKALSPSCSGLF